MCTYVCMCVCVYIYTYTEKEREGGLHLLSWKAAVTHLSAHHCFQALVGQAPACLHSTEGKRFGLDSSSTGLGRASKARPP